MVWLFKLVGFDVEGIKKNNVRDMLYFFNKNNKKEFDVN